MIASGLDSEAVTASLGCSAAFHVRSCSDHILIEEQASCVCRLRALETETEEP